MEEIELPNPEELEEEKGEAFTRMEMELLERETSLKPEVRKRGQITGKGKGPKSE